MSSWLRALVLVAAGTCGAIAGGDAAQADPARPGQPPGRQVSAAVHGQDRQQQGRQGRGHGVDSKARRHTRQRRPPGAVVRADPGHRPPPAKTASDTSPPPKLARQPARPGPDPFGLVPLTKQASGVGTPIELPTMAAPDPPAALYLAPAGLAPGFERRPDGEPVERGPPPPRVPS